MAEDSEIPPSALRDYMDKFDGENYVKGWASMWDNKAEGETLPWDRGSCSPALEDFLVQKKGFIGSPVIEGPDGQKYRRKALVPGCGTGYDVLLLASFGFDTYGLDYSEAAVETAKKEAAKNLKNYAVRDPAVGRGYAIFVQGDFFKDDWSTKLQLAPHSFDLIFDYTVRTPFAAFTLLLHCFYTAFASQKSKDLCLYLYFV